MRPPPRRPRVDPRHPHGRMWPSRSTAHPHGQRVPPGLLLAHNGRRRQRGRKHLRGMPILRPQYPPSGSRPSDHTHHMAICRMGCRHRRAPAEGARGATGTCWSQSTSSRNGLRHALLPTLGPNKSCCSSLTSSTGSGCRTPSSPTMASSSPVGKPGVPRQLPYPREIGQQSHIHRPTTASSLGSLTD
jgi:hypothetical protein